MKRHSLSLALVVAVTAVPLCATAQGFNFNDVAAVSPDYFNADRSAASLIGHRAVTQQDEHVGEVVDIIHDENQQIRGYILDIGDFPGVDSTPVFLPLDRAQVRIDGIAVELVIDISASEIEAIARLD